MHHPSARPATTRALVGAAAAAALLLTACSDSPTESSPPPPPPPPPTSAAINFQRLFVADATDPTGRLIALHNDSVVQSFNFPTRVNAAVTTESGRFVLLRMVGQNTHFVDAGVSVTNGQATLGAPMLLPFSITGGNASHHHITTDWLSVHFDGDGRAVWLRESGLAAGSPSIAYESRPGLPFHGGSITVLSNGVPFFGHSTPNPSGAPQGVTVRNQANQVVAEVPVGQCPGLHGNAAIAKGGVFGCNDGMVWVQPAGAGVVAEKVTLGGDMQGLALRNAWYAIRGTYLLGQFAAFPGQPAQRVLAKLDPQTRTITRLPALPAGVVDHFRAIEPKQERMVLLGTDGSLYIYSASAQLLRTVANVVPALPPTGALPHQIGVAENLAAIASPTQGQVVLVDLTSGNIIRRVTVGGAPSRVALVGALEAGQYTIAP